MKPIRANLSKLVALASRQASAVNVGRDETAIALASSVSGLRLDDMSKFKWDQPLNSARFGLKSPQDINRFKQNLTRLMPDAADWIQWAPISPNNTAAAVANLVAAAKRDISARSRSVSFGIPSIAVRSDLSEARTRVANVLGQDFAAKMSDRFVYRTAARMKASPAADVDREPVAVVMEFKEGTEPIADAPPVPERESFGSETAALLETALRTKRIEAVRSQCYAKVTRLRAEIEKRIAQRPSRGSATVGAEATQVCWLNGTMQVIGRPGDLADCASEQSIERIGIPRLLEREMDVSVAAIGVVAFRLASSFEGTGIQVAVIDGECDVNHPALANRVVHKNNLTSEAWGAPDVHATTIGGILCSSHAVLGGICPKATILNYKVFTTNSSLQGTDFTAAIAIQSALEDGARVANLSWGLGLGTDGNSREARAVNRAWRLGLVVVKSAGNKGPNPGTLTSPADAKDVIVVGATDREGKAVQDYSSHGPNGDHSGPDLVAPGASTAAPLHGLLLGGGTGPAGFGTSLAAPHVSGLAALLIQQNPALKPDDIRTLLRGKSAILASSSTDSQGQGFVKM